MGSIYTELALYGSQNECARTCAVCLPISEVCNGTASLTHSQLTLKYQAYRRHLIFWHARIVAKFFIIFFENMLCVMCHMSGVRCQVSHFLFHVSRGTCHMSLSPTATATDPSAANSYTIHSRMVCKDPNLIIFPQGDFKLFLSKNCKFWDQCPFITFM